MEGPLTQIAYHWREVAWKVFLMMMYANYSLKDWKLSLVIVLGVIHFSLSHRTFVFCYRSFDSRLFLPFDLKQCCLFNGPNETRHWTLSGLWEIQPCNVFKIQLGLIETKMLPRCLLFLGLDPPPKGKTETEGGGEGSMYSNYTSATWIQD